ncbi:hypothetical protein NGRA_1423 [Nosema granulosis]|uniref:CCHC-type domain-containing protein n=1 Tax=Nosema granulosis TaxID=83296 RepID=A0A9P6GYH8_9MICR|nr:hypothetical protein NGRA_1423 [Nosema granulosis]
MPAKGSIAATGLAYRLEFGKERKIVARRFAELKKTLMCYYCNRRGHIARDCRRRIGDEEAIRRYRRSEKMREGNKYERKSIREINTSNEEEGKGDEGINKTFEEYTEVYSASNIEPNNLKINVLVGKYKLKALVDTGAMVNLVHSKFVSGELSKTRERLESANGSPIAALGKKTVKFKIDDEEFEDEFIVTDEIKSEMILGLPFLKREKVQIWFGPEMKLELGKEKERKKGLGEHRIITSCRTPVVCPTYRPSHELEKEASKIIRKYIEEGIVRESSSPWRSHIVLVKKKNVEYRLIMCGLQKTK